MHAECYSMRARVERQRHVAHLLMRQREEPNDLPDVVDLVVVHRTATLRSGLDDSDERAYGPLHVLVLAAAHRPAAQRSGMRRPSERRGRARVHVLEWCERHLEDGDAVLTPQLFIVIGSLLGRFAQRVLFLMEQQRIRRLFYTGSPDQLNSVFLTKPRFRGFTLPAKRCSVIPIWFSLYLPYM